MIGCVMTITGHRQAPATPKASTGKIRTLDDLLSDSLVRIVMKADHVDPDELEATLRRVARNLVQKRGVGW